MFFIWRMFVITFVIFTFVFREIFLNDKNRIKLDQTGLRCELELLKWLYNWWNQVKSGYIDLEISCFWSFLTETKSIRNREGHHMTFRFDIFDHWKFLDMFFSENEHIRKWFYKSDQ